MDKRMNEIERNCMNDYLYFIHVNRRPNTSTRST